MKKYLYLVLIVCFNVLLLAQANAQVIITVAGKGVEGYTGNGGQAVNCQIHWPEAIALDDSDNQYIADANNNVIRKVNDRTGIITTIAGTGFQAGEGLGGFGGDGGPATLAQFSYPSGIALDATGNIYIVDQRNNRIRKIDATTGNISTVAGNGSIGFIGDGGPAVNAALYHPTRVALDASGNIFIADSGNNRIRKVNSAGIISTVAGNGSPGSGGDGGPAIMAQLYNPMDMAVDGSGNVYIADYVNNRIRKVDASGNISTYGGIGIPGYSGDSAAATAANIYEPSGILVDAAGNVYFSDLGNERVRKISASGMITTVAGNGTGGYSGDGGPAKNAQIWFPEGLAIDLRGQLYICDKANDRIRLVSAVLGVNKLNAALALLNIYPNPTHGDCTLLITSPIDEQAPVAIYNLTGQIVTRFTVNTNKSTTLRLDAPPGIYFLSATTSMGVINEKVVVR